MHASIRRRYTTPIDSTFQHQTKTGKHFGNTVYLFTPLYIANYCENYCVYCGLNCYNRIRRMKLTMGQIEDEQFAIADDRSLDKMYRDIAEEGLQPVLNDYLYV